MKEKVDEVLGQLEKHNLIVEANYSCYDLYSRVEYSSNAIGCVYYYVTDSDLLEETGKLSIRFFGKDQKDTVGIGQMVREAFEKVGLKVEWDGSPGTTIQVLQ